MYTIFVAVLHVLRFSTSSFSLSLCYSHLLLFCFFFLVLFLLFLLVFVDDNAARMWRVWRDMLNEYILQYHSTSAVETCFFFIHSLKYYICAFWPIHPPTRVATQECKVCAPRIGIVSVESDGANACYVCFIYHSAACYDMPIASNCDTRLGGLFFLGGDSGGESLALFRLCIIECNRTFILFM